MVSEHQEGCPSFLLMLLCLNCRICPCVSFDLWRWAPSPAWSEYCRHDASPGGHSRALLYRLSRDLGHHDPVSDQALLHTLTIPARLSGPLMAYAAVQLVEIHGRYYVMMQQTGRHEAFRIALKF